jgi:hypothetical protein
MITAYVYGTLPSLRLAIFVLLVDVLFGCTIVAKFAVAGVTAAGSTSDDQLATWGSITFPLVGLLDWWPAAQSEMTDDEAWTMRSCFLVSAVWWGTLVYFVAEAAPAPKGVDGEPSNVECFVCLMAILLGVWALTVQIASSVMLSDGYKSCMTEMFPEPGPCWTPPDDDYYDRPFIKRSCGANHQALAASHFFGWVGGFGTIQPLMEYGRYSALCNSSHTFVATPYYISTVWAGAWAVIYLLVACKLLRQVPVVLAGMVAPPVAAAAVSTKKKSPPLQLKAVPSVVVA